MTAFNGITGDMEVHPSRGLTKSTVRIGDRVLEQWTYLCEAEHCFAVGYSQVSAHSAEEQVHNHSCPAPMRYSKIPTGKTPLEKLWDAADMALAALSRGDSYPDTESHDERLKGFISGLAEAIAIAGGPATLGRDPTDVLRELKRRLRMASGEIPFSPTPGYRFNPGMMAAPPDDTFKVTLEQLWPHGASILIYQGGDGWMKIPGFNEIRVLTDSDGKYSAVMPTTGDLVRCDGAGQLLTVIGARLGITKHVPPTRHVQNYQTGENYAYVAPGADESSSDQLVRRTSVETHTGSPARSSKRASNPRAANRPTLSAANVAPTAPPIKMFDDDTKSTMRLAFGKGASILQLAMIYDVSEARIKSIVDPVKAVMPIVLPVRG